MEYMEQQMQNFIEAGISEADRCYTRIAELEEQNSALAAQVVYLTELVKVEAYDAYWEASDNNRSDRWNDTFDDYVRRDFEQYWATNNIESRLPQNPQHHLRQVRADAGRDGYLQGHLDAGGSSGEWDKKHSEYHANQYHASILAGKE